MPLTREKGSWLTSRHCFKIVLFSPLHRVFKMSFLLSLSFHKKLIKTAFARAELSVGVSQPFAFDLKPFAFGLTNERFSTLSRLIIILILNLLHTLLISGHFVISLAVRLIAVGRFSFGRLWPLAGRLIVIFALFCV